MVCYSSVEAAGSLWEYAQSNIRAALGLCTTWVHSTPTAIMGVRG